MDALIVTLQLDPESHDYFTALRTRYFPPERNYLSAHITLFHALPRAELAAVSHALAKVAGDTAPFPIGFSTLQRWNRGFSVKVDCPELLSVRGKLAGGFAPLLSAQDRQKYQPHLTLMNKAEEAQARLAYETFSAAWVPRQARALGLELHTYANGPWIQENGYPFRAALL